MGKEGRYGGGCLKAAEPAGKIHEQKPRWSWKTWAHGKQQKNKTQRTPSARFERDDIFVQITKGIIAIER